MIAIMALAVPVTFFRPGAHNDPTFLSVTYCAIIVAGFVQLLIYAISLVSLPTSGNLSPETNGSSNPLQPPEDEAGLVSRRETFMRRPPALRGSNLAVRSNSNGDGRTIKDLKPKCRGS